MITFRRLYISFFILVIVTISWCLLLVTDADADEVYSSILLGVFNSAKNSPTETKLVNVGYRTPFGNRLLQQVEVGGWIDTAGDGRKSSGYGSYQVGAGTNGPVFGRVMVGVAGITTPDTYLGEVFPQFTENFFIGLSGSNKNTIGIMYQHFSDAGLSKVNEGRDFAGIQVSF